jgi:hypothetical protein
MYTMLYNSPAKGDDGLYFVRATTDDKRKCFIQLNKVKIAALSGAEVTIDACSPANKRKLTAVDNENLQAAQENAVTWFGKEMTADALKTAYSHAELVADRIPPTKVFSPDQEVVDFETLTSGRECSVILEFSGMWFAKKAFGPAFNLVQVKLHPEPVKSEYPEEYAFAEEVEDEPSPEPEAEVLVQE